MVSLTSTVDHQTHLQMEDIVQNVSITRRPLGITIIAILLFISAIIEIIGNYSGPLESNAPLHRRDEREIDAV